MIQSNKAAVPWWQTERIKNLIITVLSALIVFLGGEKYAELQHGQTDEPAPVIEQPALQPPQPAAATETQPETKPAETAPQVDPQWYGLTRQPAADDPADDPPRITLPPVARIVGPSGGKSGNLLILDASSSTGEHYAWQVFPPAADGSLSYFDFEGGKKCCITGVPGVYQVFLAVSNTEGIDLARWTITVAGTDPQPDPGPGPGPQPDPDPDPEPEPQPDFTSETARRAYEEIKQTDFKPAELSLLIATLQTVANSAEKNSWSAQQILKEYQRAAGDIFAGATDAAQRWGTYDKWHQQQLFQVRDDPAGLILRMREISQGLEAAR